MCMRTRSLDAPGTLRLVERERPNLMLIVGDAFAAPLLKEMSEADARGEPYDVSSLKVLVSSGAPLSTHHKEAFQERMARIVIADTLGSSEAGVQAIAPWRPDQRATRFVMNEVTTVLDEETLEPVAGRQGSWPSRGICHLAITRTPKSPAAHSQKPAGSAGLSPVTTLSPNPTARSLCWVGAAIASTPAGRRFIRRKSKP